MLGGLLYSIGLFSAIAITIYLSHRKQIKLGPIDEQNGDGLKGSNDGKNPRANDSKNPRANDTKPTQDFDYRTLFGPLGLEFLVIFILLIWIVPYGVLVIAPIALLLSILSPAGRVAWAQTKAPRVMVCLFLISMIMLGSLAPISAPKSPDSWGSPLLSENPNAPLWPASQQYTWVMTPSAGDINFEIVQSISIRTPHQLGIYGSASSSFELASFFSLEQSRLHQAVELLDSELSFVRLDPNEIALKPILSQESYRYVSNTLSIDQELVIRQYELRSLSIGASEEGVRVGEVFCAASPSWGGELNILVVVRPLGHPDLSSDRFAEKLVTEWLAA